MKVTYTTVPDITHTDLYDIANQLAESVYKVGGDVENGYALFVSPDLAHIMFDKPYMPNPGGFHLFEVWTDYGKLEVQIRRDLPPGTIQLQQHIQHLDAYLPVGIE